MPDPAMIPSADLLPALRALVEAVAAYLEPVPDNNLLAIHERWKRLVDALPAAREALETVEAEETRAVMLSAGWKETNRQLEVAQARVALLELLLRETLEIIRIQAPSVYEALDVARAVVEGGPR